MHVRQGQTGHRAPPPDAGCCYFCAAGSFALQPVYPSRPGPSPQKPSMVPRAGFRLWPDHLLAVRALSSQRRLLAVSPPREGLVQK